MAEEIDFEEAFANALQESTKGESEADEQQTYDPLLNQEPEEDDEEELQEEVDEDYDGEEGEDETEVPADEEASAEGPSTEMLAVAQLAGVPQSFLGMARTNADVQTLIEHFRQQPEAVKPETSQEVPQEEDDLKLEDFIDSDDVDESDPAHKALSKIVGVLNEERRTNRLLLGFASQQMQREQQEQARAFQTPFDDALDGLESDVFGSAKAGLSTSQIETRKAAFQAYVSLVDGEPPERRKELAVAAVRAKFPKLLPNKSDPRREKALAKQSRKRRGAGAAKAPPERLSPEDEFAKRLMALSAK